MILIIHNSRFAVLLSTLIISMAIGVYYAVFKKQETNADLLVG